MECDRLPTMEGHEDKPTTHKCSARTRGKGECSIYADRCRDGVWYCHVHDPLGVYRQQRAALKAKEQGAVIRLVVTDGEWKSAPKEEGALARWFLDIVRKKTGTKIPPVTATA